MIHYLHIENFKSLRSVGLPLSQLNLYFGMNGMGKSSVLQALMLIRQSFWENGGKNLDVLHSNGSLLKLGTAKDIFCQSAITDKMRIYLKYSDQIVYDCKFQYDDYASDVDFLNRIESEGAVGDYSETLFTGGFSYLGAEHVGPQRQYSTENWKQNRLNYFGSKGEYVVPFLAEQGETYRVPDSLCHDAGKTNKLKDQVSAWVSEMSPGIRISAELEPFLEKARLLFGYEGERLTSDAFSPVNVGFGIPYVIPLVVVLLTCRKDHLVLIENPESHLHPKGQTMMARLIALAAENGSQILCESHSDHIINGIRVAIKKKYITPDKTQIAYFNKNSDQDTEVTLINVDQNGNLSEYPEGLLDEWGNLMAELL